MTTKVRQEVLTFDPMVMRRDKKDSRVIYDSTRNLVDSAATISGNIYIGVKDKPSPLEIRDTIQHEKCHVRLGHKVARGYLKAAEQELEAYQIEKQQSSPQTWARVSLIRVGDFLPSVSHLSKREQVKIAPRVAIVLSPKGYSDAKRQRLSRRYHRGWKRIT
jgi:hypothetical protein